MTLTRIKIENHNWIIEEVKPVQRKIGRPRNRQAKYSLIVRRPNGCTRYASFLYNDGSFCKPF